ncbi:hypothetical protein ABZZ36_42180 [Actinacidiphila glaucinigra]
METGHSGWVARLLSGRSAMFYDGLRRPGRRGEAEALAPSRGIAVHPLP